MRKSLLLFVLFYIVSLHAFASIDVRTKYLSISNGLNSNHVRSIVQDPQGFIWMGTTNGLIRYDGYTTYLITPSDAPNRRLMADSRILAIRLWQDRYILVMTNGRKYSCYDTQTDQFIEKSVDYQKLFDERQTVDNRGNAVRTTPDGEVWVTNARSHQTVHLSGIYSQELLRRNGTPRYGVITDRDGIIWISTYGNGLFAHDPKTGETTHWLKDANNQVPILTNYLIHLYEDRTGNIWVSQENMGVVCLRKQRQSVERIFFTTPEQLDHTNSIHLLARTDRQIFIGNRYNGLKITNGLLADEKLVEQYGDDIVTLCTDQQGTVWVGTRKSGIYCGNRNYRNVPDDPHSLSKGKISDILCDRQGRIWISIFDGGVDLAIPDGNGNYTFRHFFTGQQAIQQPRQMLCDFRGDIWLCSNEGLYTFQPEKLIADSNSFSHISVNTDNPYLDEIHCIYETKGHHILAGVQEKGLAVISNDKAGEYRIERMVTTQEGLPNNNVQQLAIDRYGNLWIGTNQGLARYDIQKKQIATLMPANNILGNMFVENAVCSLDDGRMAFGTHHGIVVVDPKRMTDTHQMFQLRITDIDINGIATHATEKISLDYHQNSLVFHFSDFQFADSQESRYSYRLKDYDKEWSPMSSQNWASYKNLPSGRYTMEVRSGDGTVATMEVVIAPPFWATWWAYLIYICIVAGITWAAFGHFKRVNELHNRIKVEEQLTEYKMQFFTNISHEFRTPLTIIRGAMERIQASKQMPGDMKQPVSTMQKGVNRLMRMINQLMEFSKVHEGKLRLAVEDTEIVGFIRDIFSTFREMAENKHIDYHFSTSDQSFQAFIDRSFLDKIVYNLISNAFKYTPQGGQITVRLMKGEPSATTTPAAFPAGLTLEVRDTGIGIDKDKQRELFARFNQSVFSKDSIGIGLHLTHELVCAHHGTISYEENPGGGSIFKVMLPTEKTAYSEEEFLKKDTKLHEEEAFQPMEYKEMAGEPMNDLYALVVEDDNDVREFLLNGLRNYFHCEAASDGEEALRMIGSRRPDLIVSDVMMPGINGFELTQKIRSEQALADIPIILLTALNEESKQVRGLTIGADAYLTKPFSMNVLTARCFQLLEQRQQLRTNYAKEVVNKSETPALIIDEQEKRLRSQLDTWLATHLKDADLSIDAFAQKMGYGRTTFYKKVKKLTGLTPNDYIKSLRMARAIELLQNDTMTIAQVAYEVGFDDPYYFSKSFKSYYGISPSQYRKGEKPTR